MKNNLLLFCSILLFIGCGSKDEEGNVDDLNSIKKSFLLSIFEGNVEESPFRMDYQLSTIFFSPNIISLFGKLNVYEHLPHGWQKYEGKTFYKVHGKFKEINLWDLFTTKAQKEFLRKYCEDNLKAQTISYFSGENPLRSHLELEDIHSFVIDEKSLIIFFQTYTVGGLEDHPWQVKIPYKDLKEKWNASHPFSLLLKETISSKSYTNAEKDEGFLSCY